MKNQFTYVLYDCYANELYRHKQSVALLCNYIFFYANELYHQKTST